MSEENTTNVEQPGTEMPSNLPKTELGARITDRPDAAYEAEAARVDAPHAKLDAVIQKWAHDRLHNSPLSAATGAWNHLTSELGELRKRLIAEFGI